MADGAALEVARLALRLPVLDLWIAYFALGGLGDASHLRQYLGGGAITTDHDHNLIVHALNEVYSERGRDSPVPYRND